MKRERPSQTAAMVAFLRALADAGLASVPSFSDPTARVMLPRPWSLALRALEERMRAATPRRRARVAVGVDLLALRTMVIDEALRSALARGVAQVVILGAGLDGRAFRIRELAEARVFEVDHPATQAYKRRRARALEPAAAEVRYVGVDFERDRLAPALAHAGHDARSPTFFIWEGVVLYLTDGAVATTLGAVSDRAAPGSGMILTYGTPASREWWLTALLHLWNEPHIGERTREEMEALVRGAGLVVEEESGLADWAARFGAGPQDPRRAVRYRAILARR